MRTITPDNFDAYVENFCSRKRDFTIQTKRHTNSMYLNNELQFVGKIKKKSLEKKETRKLAINLFAQVQKNINSFYKKANFKVEKIKDKHPSTKSKISNWKALEINEAFWYIDINHCYWRIAFLKGYINERLYKATLAKPELKIERNMSLAMIIAPKKRKYYKKGELVLEVEEDKRFCRIIYDNIRFTAYNLMGECMKLSGKSFLGYRTDGIMVKESAVNKIAEHISDAGYEYSIQKCVKVDGKNYKDEKGDIIKF